MDYEVVFDKYFFENIKERWLRTKEIFLLLKNIEEILSSNLLNISNTLDSKPKDGDYYIIKSDKINIWKTKDFNKETLYELKVLGKPMIKCAYSTSSNLQRRIYYLMNNPSYSFIQYHHIELHKQKKTKQSLTTKVKIISYAPNYIYENTSNTKMLIVIESNTPLSNHCNDLTISFGDIKVKGTLIASNIIECLIPQQNKCEIFLEIYLNNFSVSLSDQMPSFHYLQSNTNQFHLNASSNGYDFPLKQKTFSIFHLNNKELQSRISAKISEFKSQIQFYSLKQKDIDISFLTNDFNEENLKNIINIIYNILNQLSKLPLMDLVDNFGYNLLHYTCAINYSSTLKLLNYYDIDLEAKAIDNLTAYEICAGKRNLACLETLIEIIESYDNDNEGNVFNHNHLNENKVKSLYDLDVLKSALNLSLDNNSIEVSDIEVLDLLIKRIRIKYTVDSTSGNIVKHMKDNNHNRKNEGEVVQEKNSQNKGSIEDLQKYIRGWLRRNKYKKLKKAAIRLTQKCKNTIGRRSFINQKNSIIHIQQCIKRWLDKKHTTKK